MSNFDDEIKKAMKRVTDRLFLEGVLGESPPYSAFLSTGSMLPSIRPSRPSRPSRPFPNIVPIPSITVVVNPYLTRTVKYSRKKTETFWAKWWRLFWDHDAWPVSPIEYFEQEVPAMMMDRRENTVICHPALEGKVNEIIKGGIWPC